MNALTDELALKGSGPPELAARSSSEPTDLPNTLRASSSMLSDIEGKRLLPALTTRTPTPHRAPSALSLGILLYLLSVGIVATATVGVFFGIAFFFLAQTTEATNANVTTRDHGVDAEHRLLHTLPNASSTYGASASVPIELQTSRSAPTAALPVASVAPLPARPRLRGDVSASDAQDQFSGARAPDSGASEASPNTALSTLRKAEPVPGSSVAAVGSEAAHEASPNAAQSTLQKTVPMPGSSVGAAGPEAAHEVSPDAAQSTLQKTVPVQGSSVAAPAPEAVPRITAIQIAELLARGDSFLHAGDVASARLFYERAADAGDWQSAIRMGATFDPAFLDRAGVHTVGDPIKAQSWYRHALDLGAPKSDRQVESSQTK